MPATRCRMRTTSTPALCAALAMVLAAAVMSAQAASPLVTEDAEVPERGDCEIDASFSWLRADGAIERALELKPACGIGWGTQLALALGRAEGDGTQAHYAVLGGKTALVALDEATRLAVAYEAGWVAPSGGATRLEATLLAGVLSHAWGDGWTGHANLGWVRLHEDDRDRLTWNLALEYAASESLDLTAEAYRRLLVDPWLAAGLRWRPAQDLAVYASIARQTSGLRATLGVVGLTLSF